MRATIESQNETFRTAAVPLEFDSQYNGFPVRVNYQLDRLYPIARDRQRQFYCADCLFLPVMLFLPEIREVLGV